MHKMSYIFDMYTLIVCFYQTLRFESQDHFTKINRNTITRVYASNKTFFLIKNVWFFFLVYTNKLIR